MYLDTKIKKECRGCGACAEKCPVKAISMNFIQGFRYPTIDTGKCIHCNICKRICAETTDRIDYKRNEIDNQTNDYLLKYFYGWNKDKAQRYMSTSGGAFPAIVQSWIELHPDSWIYGVVYDENNHVLHTGTQDLREVQKMCRSKYVQSDMDSVYQEILNRLQNCEYVLFSGTPCQVSALKTVIGKDTEYLLTVEFVCHGVMSPMLFEKYMKQLGQKKNAKVLSYSFRNKRNDFFKKSLRMIRIEYSDGSVKETEKDLLVMAYKNRLFYRESCFDCPFATKTRCADFTIGDFWGIEKTVPQLKSERINGISMIMLNTKSALKLENLLCSHMYLEEAPIESLSYGQMMQPTIEPQIKGDFERINSENDIVQVIKSCLPYYKRFFYLHPKLRTILFKLIHH